MAEKYCGTDKADYSEDEKECFNEKLEMTVSKAEHFLEEMREINIDMANIKYEHPMLIEMMAENTSKAREVIKELNKAMIK